MSKRRPARLRVFIFGAGKVGSSLAGKLRASGARVVLRAARSGLPRRRIDADVVIVAVRDRDILPIAESLAVSGLIPKSSVAVHVAGALSAESLAPLRSVCAGVAQMHPMISFARAGASPSLERGNMHIAGDAKAVLGARRLARSLGMTPRTVPDLDPIGYHAAAGLVANGSAALAALGCELLVRSGVRREDTARMLGPLLRSVAENVEAIGMPGALTGPVRRGDAAGLKKHLETLTARLAEAVPLYLESALAQLPLARQTADAATEKYDDVELLLRDAVQKLTANRSKTNGP